MKRITILCLSIISFGIILFNLTDTNEVQASENVTDYFQEVSIDFFDIPQTGYIYIKKNSCPNCKTFEPDLINYIKKKDLHVYSIDLEKYQNKKMKTKLNKFLNYYNVTGVPDLIKLDKNMLIKRLSNDERSSDELFDEFFQN